MPAKTPTGKYVKAQLDFDRWLSRLIAAAKRVDIARRRIKYYEREYDATKRGKSTRVRAPKINVWGTTQDRRGRADT